MGDIKEVMVQNYIPYCKATIISRAVPWLDGLKPCDRRILYTMFNNMGLTNGKKAKSNKITGYTMGDFHPHGDSAIYESMCKMTDVYGGYNVPYVMAKGSFGRVYSNGQASASRYTEAGLMPICNELFDGIKENAVNMMDNFDHSTKEPELLPVKFPTILANHSSGIAVGFSSNIPAFNLRKLCNATAGIALGKITNSVELYNVIGTPEYTTGGILHGTDADFIKLLSTGRGSFNISGCVELYKNKIVINEIPYNTTIEGILEEINNAVKEGNIKEVSETINEIGKNGLKATIVLKRGSDPELVLRKLYKYSKLRSNVYYNIRVIINNECKERSVFDLLEDWIEFRVNTLRRIYTFRAESMKVKLNRARAWGKIINHLKEIANLAVETNEAEYHDELMKRYGLDDEQAEYIMDIKSRQLTKDRSLREIAKIEGLVSECNELERISKDDSELVMVMVKELDAIATKYSKKCTTQVAPPVEKEVEEDFEEEIKDTNVCLIVTKEGYIKRLITIRDMENIEFHENDYEVKRYGCSNKDTLLIFTYGGNCYKVPVYNIDASRGVPKDLLKNYVDASDNTGVMYIALAGDYSDHFNVVYENGRGYTVFLSSVSGNRSKYINLFKNQSDNKSGRVFVTEEDEFFLITKKKAAAYMKVRVGMGRSAFKVARISKNDEIDFLLSAKDIPNIKEIDLERYSKGYCVKLKDNI